MLRMLHDMALPTPIPLSANEADQDLHVMANSAFRCRLFGPRRITEADTDNPAVSLMVQYRDIYEDARLAMAQAKQAGKVDLQASRLAADMLKEMWRIIHDMVNQRHAERVVRMQMTIARPPSPSTTVVPTKYNTNPTLKEIESA